MDTVSDSLAKIKNAILSRKTSVVLKDTKLTRSIMDVLQKEGFITAAEATDEGLSVEFALEAGKPVITDLKRVSKPGQRVYVRSNQLHPVYAGRGVGVVSTSKGIMSAEEAKDKNLGGEYICQIW